MSETGPLDDEWRSIEGAGDRLLAFVGADSTKPRGRVLVEALQRGAPASEALRSAGAPAPLANLFAQEPPSSLPGVLDRVAAAIGRSETRRRQLRAVAAYPLAAAAAAGFAAWVVRTAMLPAISFVNVPPPQPLDSMPLDPTLALAAIALAGLLLVVFAASLALDVPLPPFSGAREVRERALVLGVASAFASSGSALPGALKAAAGLVSGKVRQATTELAGALERGEAEARGVHLLGPLGAALFAAAAKEGGGAASLEGLAALAEETAATETPVFVFRAELLTMLLAGAAVVLAAVSFMAAYAGVLGRS